MLLAIAMLPQYVLLKLSFICLIEVSLVMRNQIWMGLFFKKFFKYFT